MAPIDSAIETFEEGTNRILWLPPITLGYIFTISGSTLDFGLAVGAIGGARYFIEFLESDLTQNSDIDSQFPKDTFKNIISVISSNFRYLRDVPYVLLVVLYPISLLYSIWRLYLFFTHTDPVFVGLAGIYCGVAVILFTNGWFLLFQKLKSE